MKTIKTLLREVSDFIFEQQIMVSEKMQIFITFFFTEENGVFATKSLLYSWYYAEECSEVAHLRGLGPEKHSFDDMQQRWRAVGDTVSDLIDPRIEPRTSCCDSGVLNHYVKWPRNRKTE